MNAENDLFHALQCAKVDQAEFEQLVASYFGHGYHAGPQEIHHAVENKGCALRAIYDEDGKLISVRPGPDLQDGQIEALQANIEQELLAGKPTVQRLVLFTGVPTDGYFRYRDLFQIIPVPPEAPRPKYIIGEHPLCLEFKVTASTNFMITSVRRQRVGRELELLLSSLFRLRIWSIGPETRHQWSLDVSDGAIVLPSKFLQEGYAWNGATIDTDDFSSTADVPEVIRIEPNEYYSLRGISLDSKFSLPSNIESQIDRFFSLTRDDREKFLRASYWFQHAHTVFSYSKSASFIALVSAIEALMPPPKGGKQCPECKQMLGTGPTKQFVDFVESHIPGSAIPVEERKRFYRVRSALSHGGKLLSADHGVWGFTPKQLGEGHDARIVWQIVQSVLHNWLATK